MKYINMESLRARTEEIKADFQSKKPFRYTCFENFFYPEQAEQVYKQYPKIENGQWDGTLYIHQKNKFQKTKFDDGSIFKDVFNEMNSQEFIDWVEEITGIEARLSPDHELFGGGLHQSTNGAFLNVHLDYNLHPVTKLHRRLNAIVYLNKDWKREYEGCLELWDFTQEPKRVIDQIMPLFNRCVIFETNEVSYHGHPKPLNTPADVNRKSIATFYYSETRPAEEFPGNRETYFTNTEGLKGQVKNFAAGVKAAIQRISKK